MPEITDSSRVDRLVRFTRDFLQLEASGGLLLMGAAAVALLIANSPLAFLYDDLLGMRLEVRVGELEIAKPLLLWINDGLMAVFFFLVGLELKREVLEGHLSSLRKAALPAFAALGGMVAPAALYVFLNQGDAEALDGWAIPTATDIAFALGVLLLLGNAVPTALKAFLLSVAIFDDIGAILIIALFYTEDLSLLSLGIAAAVILGLFTLNRLGVRREGAYVLLGIALWVAVLKSGVHATLAGVVVALFIPLREQGIEGEDSMLHRLEQSLHPWVAFGVLPAFAFANAGVPLAGVAPADLLQPVPLGIFLGLFLGKQAGILAMSVLAVRLRLAAPPEGVTWLQLYGVMLLCGIGFTMSLFIATLAFAQGGAAPYMGLERLGILMGSLASGLAGYAVLRLALRREAR